MKGFNTEELIAHLQKITDDNKQFVKKKCVHLGEEQLNWRPKVGSWNILEVLSHLNAYSVYYHEHFREKIARTKFKNVKEHFVSSPLGKSAWKSMKLGRANNIKRKFKAPKSYNPSHDSAIINEDAADVFIENQQQLKEILESAKNVNLKKVKIPISISKIARLRLGDALMFIIYHNERHVQQIKNIMTHSNFPKK
ncbi:MAG: DinB family protein [Bacteroidota bacterium]